MSGSHTPAPPEVKRHRRTFTLATLVSVLACTAGFSATWSAVLQPMLVSAVATAAAEELDHKIAAAVKAEVLPLKKEINAGNQGLQAVIIGNILGLEEDIERLRYIRDYQEGKWTVEMAQQLLSKMRALDTQKRALEEIRSAGRAPAPR